MIKCPVCGKEFESPFTSFFAEEVAEACCSDECGVKLRRRERQEAIEKDNTPLEHQGPARGPWPQ